MSNLSPAEDAEMFTKAAAYVASLDEGDLRDFLMEVQMHGPNIETMVGIKIAAQDVIDGWHDIQELA